MLCCPVHASVLECPCPCLYVVPLAASPFLLFVYRKFVRLLFCLFACLLLFYCFTAHAKSA